ncbi:MAG TPA: hypothetical protein VK031_07065 [Tissierellaceae bacterium]|nr:hypothetical protein [Tissierellaceae bacterium]
MAKKVNLTSKALETLKALFSSVSLGFSQFEDGEGNIYQYSVLEVGAEVFIATAEGSEPAPDGEYKVDEVTSIKVEDGLITEVNKEEKEESEEEEVVEVDVLSDFKKALSSKLKGTGKFSDEELAELLEYEEDLEELVEEVAETEEEEELLGEVVSGITNLITENKEVKDEVEELKEEIEALKEGFSKLASEPVKTSKKVSFNSFDNDNKEGKATLQSVFSRITK